MKQVNFDKKANQEIKQMLTNVDFIVVFQLNESSCILFIIHFNHSIVLFFAYGLNCNVSINLHSSVSFEVEEEVANTNYTQKRLSILVAIDFLCN